MKNLLKAKPLHRKGDLTTGKPCTKCKAPFDLLAWPVSKWTESGWSPWCPKCHADFAGDDFNRFNNRRKPGPKPGAKRLNADVDNASTND